MNYFIKGISAALTAFSLCTSAFASTQINDTRILSAPIWMPNDLLVDNENVPRAFDNVMHPESEMGFTESYNGNQKFTNNVDGYSVIVPSDMKPDMSLSDTGAILSDSYKTLKIFKETFDTAGERLSYLSYSNKFAENTADHKVEKQSSFTQNGREYHILQWSRQKLSSVKDDKNNYVCVDVCIGARVYTFFFASSRPFTQESDYMSIVNSLSTFDASVPQANAYNKGYKLSSLSHLGSAAKSTYNNLFSYNAKFTLGMFPPDKFGGFEKMEEFEEKLGYKFSSFLVYTEFTDKTGAYAAAYNTKVNNYMAKIAKNLQYAQRTGKAIELTLQTPLERKSDKNMIYEILNGEYDYFLSAYGKMLASYPNVTVLMRPFNEMNGDWCNYSAFHTSRDPQIYVELYRYVHSKISESGAKNIIWVWNPNERSFPGYKWNSQDLYYPGDEYVDVYGITGYNTGTYYEGESWRSFDEIYAPIYERAMRINEKPIMITEFSCSAIGGDKIKWIEDMFIPLPKYDKIKMGIWWHATDYDGQNLSRPYFMDTPDGTMDIFDKYLGGD